jgi:hypothetical protein
MKKFSIFIISIVFLMAGSIAFTEINKSGIGKDLQQQTGPACDNGECHGKIWGISEANAGQKNVCLTCHTTQGVMSIFGFKAFLGALDHFPLPDEYYTHPEACVVCHTGREVHGGFAEDFAKIVHKGHLVDPEGRILEKGNNHFAIMYGGKCTHCHVVNKDGTFSMPGMESLFED